MPRARRARGVPGRLRLREEHVLLPGPALGEEKAACRRVAMRGAPPARNVTSHACANGAEPASPQAACGPCSLVDASGKEVCGGGEGGTEAEPAAAPPPPHEEQPQTMRQKFSALKPFVIISVRCADGFWVRRQRGQRMRGGGTAQPDESNSQSRRQWEGQCRAWRGTRSGRQQAQRSPLPSCACHALSPLCRACLAQLPAVHGDGRRHPHDCAALRLQPGLLRLVRTCSCKFAFVLLLRNLRCYARCAPHTQSLSSGGEGRGRHRGQPLRCDALARAGPAVEGRGAFSRCGRRASRFPPTCGAQSACGGSHGTRGGGGGGGNVAAAGRWPSCSRRMSWRASLPTWPPA